MIPDLKFHHLGLAVTKPEFATKFVETLGYRVMNSVFDPHQNVNLAICVHQEQPSIEIIWPGDTPGPIHDLAARHSSGIVYHVCYETSDLRSALECLNSAGIKAVCISPQKPAPLFNNRLVSFYNIRGMGLIEILE